MKLTDLAVLFIIIILPFTMVLRIQSDNLQKVTYKQLMLNRYLDTAVEDASKAMVVRGENREVTISNEKAMEAFYTTLFTHFNVLDSHLARNTLSVYIPVIVLIDYDGYSFYSMEEYLNGEGEREQKMVWKPKKPYVYEKDDFVYLFTLDQKVTVYDTNSREFYEGVPRELQIKVPGADILQLEHFESVRTRTIVEAIKKDTNEAINHHNAYAKRFGISYIFSPPSIPDTDWHRNIEDVGFLAFFQGLPLGLNRERYNHFALGAARIVRKNHFYIQEETNGLYYYHREQCADLADREETFDTREECALKGAFPCPLCNP